MRLYNVFSTAVFQLLSQFMKEGMILYIKELVYVLCHATHHYRQLT